MTEKKQLVLIRHGETLFNQKKRIQGACDSPLTPLGIEQAKAAAELLKNRNMIFDHAYCSTSERACDTLELISSMPYRRLKGLKENHFGLYEGEPEYLNPPLDQYSAFFKAAGGETQEEVKKRMKKTLTDLMNQEDHHSVLAVSHAGAIINFTLLWQPDFLEKEGGLANCAVLVFEYDPEHQTFSLKELMKPETGI